VEDGAGRRRDDRLERALRSPPHAGGSLRADRDCVQRRALRVELAARSPSLTRATLTTLFLGVPLGPKASICRYGEGQNRTGDTTIFSPPRFVIHALTSRTSPWRSTARSRRRPSSGSRWPLSTNRRRNCSRRSTRSSWPWDSFGRMWSSGLCQSGAGTGGLTRRSRPPWPSRRSRGSRPSRRRSRSKDCLGRPCARGSEFYGVVRISFLGHWI
jgi:hypothetical protein